jgi:hypothetical protein
MSNNFSTGYYKNEQIINYFRILVISQGAQKMVAGAYCHLFIFIGRVDYFY